MFKKVQNFFVPKMTPKIVVLHSCKKPLKSLKKNFLKTKTFLAYLCMYDLQTSEQNFLKINRSRDTLTSGNFMVSASCSL